MLDKTLIRSTFGAGLIVLALVSSSSCSASLAPNRDSDVLRVEIDRASYRAGESVRVTLTNTSEDNLSYHFCSATRLERKSGSSWVLLDDRARVCTMELRFLLPGQAVTASLGLPTDLTSGMYRYRFWVGPVDAPPSTPMLQRVSPSFEVTP